ncbi:MAG TPA: helix-turn-helix transcriptional regulator [Bacteroidia bacterium]|nr:helix-turn-helix transcriptional regulator [Bacteroidia bacterium]
MITIRDLMYASKLKALRAQKNVKQLNAAGLIGIECQQHYSDYESGKKHFSEEIIVKISEGFKIPITEFKRVDYEILNEMIYLADLSSELQTYVKRLSNKERYLFLLECEKRLVEVKLENMRKNKEILELENYSFMRVGEPPPIYVLA